MVASKCMYTGIIVKATTSGSTRTCGDLFARFAVLKQLAETGTDADFLWRCIVYLKRCLPNH